MAIANAFAPHVFNYLCYECVGHTRCIMTSKYLLTLAYNKLNDDSKLRIVILVYRYNAWKAIDYKAGLNKTPTKMDGDMDDVVQIMHGMGSRKMYMPGGKEDSMDCINGVPV
jgi:hypothetical protein